MHIEALRDFCLSLPGVTEDIKWGADLCFSVDSKMFCITSTEAPHTVSFKVKAEEFEELASSANIIPAPYMARNKWVQVQAWSRFTDEQWEYYVKQSYEIVKSKLPKKVQQAIG
ncbi:MmcQ/YjbR family DNA-binding protein [Pontibacter sp. 172403-2]|uniref:MmcQ/YjbR family DNA-binding protein n=1 Tax=Pontibacter rufus TaxID=2791028 RepID=UPI0018AF7AFD|nr:MmcQ/YjbR family DNA-binding protein [Pontibacter sp. 172403-2]MBF9253821.1 MmcQ/YjbR family DNA-binding protein [Pontibacter sp. 172403-2]